MYDGCFLLNGRSKGRVCAAPGHTGPRRTVARTAGGTMVSGNINNINMGSIR